MRLHPSLSGKIFFGRLTRQVQDPSAEYSPRDGSDRLSPKSNTSSDSPLTNVRHAIQISEGNVRFCSVCHRKQLSFTSGGVSWKIFHADLLTRLCYRRNCLQDSLSSARLAFHTYTHCCYFQNFVGAARHRRATRVKDLSSASSQTWEMLHRKAWFQFVVCQNHLCQALRLGLMRFCAGIKAIFRNI